MAPVSLCSRATSEFRCFQRRYGPTQQSISLRTVGPAFWRSIVAKPVVELGQALAELAEHREAMRRAIHGSRDATPFRGSRLTEPFLSPSKDAECENIRHSFYSKASFAGFSIYFNHPALPERATQEGPALMSCDVCHDFIPSIIF